jgi:hypothetical protein
MIFFGHVQVNLLKSKLFVQKPCIYAKILLLLQRGIFWTNIISFRNRRQTNSGDSGIAQ